MGNVRSVERVVVLQGGGPFVSNDDLDADLLRGLGGPVAVLPTADAFERPGDLVRTAVEWGARHGADVVPCPVYVRADALDESNARIIRDAAAVWVVGDSPIHLRSTVMHTPVFQAIAACPLVAAVAGSAAALCDPMVDPRGGAFALGLGLVRGLALITESERWGRERLQRSLHLANTPVVELPTGSALVRRDGSWTVHGAVTVHGDLPAA